MTTLTSGFKQCTCICDLIYKPLTSNSSRSTSIYTVNSSIGRSQNQLYSQISTVESGLHFAPRNIWEHTQRNPIVRHALSALKPLSEGRRQGATQVQMGKKGRCCACGKWAAQTQTVSEVERLLPDFIHKTCSPNFGKLRVILTKSTWSESRSLPKCNHHCRDLSLIKFSCKSIHNFME